MKTPTKQTSHRLAAVLSLAFAATGAWAEDWTVSENTTLTEDLTVDALTVNSGVTLDLAGYKLTCTSIDGEGTITSLGTDLTAPGGTCWASPSAAQVSHGTVANLFSNNYTYNPDATHRFLLASDRLPVCIDYNFGAGNAQVVNAYKLWAGWKQRAPKAWTLYGSNNDSAYQADSETDWVAIDSHSGETDWWQENGNAKDYTADDNTYTCDNTTAYRYYRLKVTERVGGNAYFEIVQLEYFCATPGELHVNVADGETATVGSLTISGNVKVVKDGAGTLAASGDLTMTGGLNVNEGSLVVKSGTVTVSGGYMYIGNVSGKTAEVQVDGGTLTVNGGSDNPALMIGNDGTGTLTINGGTVTVASNKDTYLAYNTGSTGTLNLNGGTLVTRRVMKKSGSSRTLNFNGGTLKANSAVQQTGLIADGVTVNVGEGGGTIDSGNLSTATTGGRVFVAAAIGGTGAMTFKGGKTINVEGAVNCTGGTIVELGTKIAANATTKDSILANLVVDGNGVTEVGDYTVFQYSGGTLDATDLANVSFVNCGPATTKEIVDGNTIVVHFSPLAFTLDADKTWSELIGAISLTSDVVVPITVMDSDATLTVDKNVSVGQIEFTTGDGATLKINEGYTLTTGDIAGIGYILNNGTLDKTGDGTLAIAFDNASRGVFVVNAGTLRATGARGTDYGTPITGDPDETPRSTFLIDVKSGATYDVNGTEQAAAAVRLAAGAHFVNTGNDARTGWIQSIQLILAGDADVDAQYNFGLVAQGFGATRLDLGSHTLSVRSNSGKDFQLSGTTITGSGTIDVTAGRLVVRNAASAGADCTLVIEDGANLGIAANLTVKNFENKGTTVTGGSSLTVTDTLTPGNGIPNLTLASGATVKASASQKQTVTKTFSASGTVYIDASDITREQLNAATYERIPVLTVPSVPSGVTWDVAGKLPVEGCRAKWFDDEGGTKTLYLCKPTGLMIIFT